MSAVNKLWYTECSVCDNLNKTFQRCNCALYKPKSDGWMCVLYLEKLNKK